jgi:hypothetical protein
MEWIRGLSCHEGDLSMDERKYRYVLDNEGVLVGGRFEH